MRDGPPPRSRSSPSTAAIEVPDMCEAISQHKRGWDVMLALLAPIAGRHGVFTQSGHRRCACAHSTEAHFRHVNSQLSSEIMPHDFSTISQRGVNSRGMNKMISPDPIMTVCVMRE